jgi:CO/xanthine dehydrogenase Mo-binding subunit
MPPPAIYCEVKVVFTNTVPTNAYRGAGRPVATFALGRLVDIATRDLGVDRVEIRRRNFIRRDAFPYRGLRTGALADCAATRRARRPVRKCGCPRQSLRRHHRLHRLA